MNVQFGVATRNRSQHAAREWVAPVNAVFDPRPFHSGSERPEQPDGFEYALRLTLNEDVACGTSAGACAQTLGNLAVLIGNRFETDVCSIYVFEPDRVHLVLAATVGLRQDSIGHVRMRTDEGLVGLVAEGFCPVAVEEAASHPRFKYFPNAGEDPYHSFLGVPAASAGVLQGVLTVQTIEPRTFSRQETERLVRAGEELGAILEAFRSLR